MIDVSLWAVFALFLGCKKLKVCGRNGLFLIQFLLLLLLFSTPLCAAEFYEISTYQEFETFSELVERGEGQKLNVRLMRDIVIDGEHKPIGSMLSPFQGTFDGGGHVITWATGACFEKDAYLLGGIFGYVSSKNTTIPTIKDLTIVIDAPIVFPQKMPYKDGDFGVLAGFIERSEVYNCCIMINRDIRVSASHAGGLIGRISFIDGKQSFVDSCLVELSQGANLYLNADVAGGCVG